MSYKNGNCSQCGKRFIESACGPTHLSILMERDLIATAALADGYTVAEGVVMKPGQCDMCRGIPKNVMGLANNGVCPICNSRVKAGGGGT